MTTTFMFGASKVGAIPLAVAIHTSQSEENYKKAFQLIKEELGQSAFGGNGHPNTFRIDDSKAEFNALKAVWPKSVILLCAFHVLQSVWRWLWEAKNTIKNEHRQHIMLLFKQALYCKNEIEFDELCDILLSDNVVILYDNFVKYFNVQWAKRKEIWALCFRVDLFTRGHHTNNYVESAIRIFKEVILIRCKAFNTVALLDFVVNSLENYHCTRLTNFASGRTTKNELEYRKFFSLPKLNITATATDDIFYVASSKDENIVYTVNVSSEICDCLRGQVGHFCKHLFAVSDKFNLKFNTSPKISYEDKLMLATIAFGKIEPNFYLSMMPKEQENASVSASACNLGKENSPRAQDNNSLDTTSESDSEELDLEITKYLKEQNRIMASLRNEPSSAKFALKVLKSANSALSELQTPNAVLGFLQQKTSSRNGKIIPVNSTGTCRRVPSADGKTYGGKGRVSSGRRPADSKGAPKKKKRPNNLSQNIWLNQPNAKPHGSGH